MSTTNTTPFDTLEQLEEAAAAVPAPDCPPWCTRPAGHRYESTDGLSLDSGVRRGHEHSFGSFCYVYADEQRDPDGTVRHGRARVGIDCSGLEDVAPDTALMLAGQLREAALLAERANRGRA